MAAREIDKSRGRVWRRLVLPGVCAVVLLSVLAQWTHGRRPSATRSSAPAGQVGYTVGRPVGHAAANHAPHPVSAAAPSPADASLQLQELLGQHSVLAADMMRGRLRGDPDLAQAANAALGKNTAAIGGLVGGLFGDQAKSTFVSLWSGHVTALFNYARGLADKDEGVRAQAESVIEKFESDLAEFFSAASNGRLPSGAAHAAVKAHVDHLLQQADAYAAKDYPRADQLYREAYSHTFALGQTLAATLLPPAAAATLKSSTWQLRSELGRLLGEHVVLVVSALRAGATNGADFSAAAASVNANTRDLAAAVDTLFGPAAARQFQSLWADHVDALVAYSAAVVKQDQGQRAEVESRLAAFERRLAAFLGTATGNRLDAVTLAKAFRMHDQMLLGEVNAFAAQDYGQAHDVAYSTYQQMFDLAGQLATAFGSTVGAVVPRGAVQTGRGGMAGLVGG